MLWGSDVGLLCVLGLTFKGATGLSPISQKLLIQRGAERDNLHPMEDQEWSEEEYEKWDGYGVEFSGYEVELFSGLEEDWSGEEDEVTGFVDLSMEENWLTNEDDQGSYTSEVTE
ncbi:MAG: hypothetical protein J3R72DRAFT_453612 [Linnemannia gamsii]|nr:MAG: hypothetical protein J3R72DRAFT_453612 [Linnemannia gamsii]